jgi:hypothetical protein
MDNPNNAVRPDYTSANFEEDRAPFLAIGLTEEQAVDLLSEQWTLKNNREKEVWGQQQQQRAEAAAEREEREEEERQRQEDEDAQILKDERKKNKAKFAPIPNVPVSSEPITLPSQVAIRKIQQHKFCELWYFTNDGLDAADASLSYAIDDDSLSFVPSTDGTPTLVPTASARDKSHVTQDENLSMEQFGQASPRMIPFMYDHGWAQPHVQMHINFWSTIENHKWRNSRNRNQQRALLVYQGQQRRRWHNCITSPRAFDLSIINDEVLRDTLDDILIQMHSGPSQSESFAT